MYRNRNRLNIYFVYLGENMWIYFDQVLADGIRFKIGTNGNGEINVYEIILFEDCK